MAEMMAGYTAHAHPSQSPSPFWKGVRRLWRSGGFMVGLVGLVAVLAAAVAGPGLLAYDPLAQDLASSFRPPFWAEGGALSHPLGTDALGRDVASRLAYGARNSLVISVTAALLGSLLGLGAGLVAGFYGRRVDAVIMRLGDIQLAFPFVLLAIAVLGTTTNRTPLHLILVLGIPGWAVYARVVRSRVLAEREKEYALAARAVGAGSLRRLLRYILPNVWQVVPVIAMLDLGFLVIVESMLSFLGFGLTPPTPSWGSILADGKQYMLVSPWLPILPGLAILISVLSINLVADGAADVLDPKLARGGFRRLILRQLAELPAEVLPMPLLRVRDLVTEFSAPERVVRAVRGISFDLDRGQSMGIVGESGAGKSVTALSIIQLLDSPGRVTGGQILFDGMDLARIPDKVMASLRGRRMGLIFQNPASSLNPVLTVGAQMLETLRHHHPTSRSVAWDVARQALLAVGIGNPDGVLKAYPFQLSGGMNQRVMIAMAMALRPDLLIADEPTTALDVTTQAQILEQLRQIKEQHGTSVILITHDIAMVAEFADHILVMYAGQICEQGPAQAVIRTPHHPYTKALLNSVPRPDLASGVRLAAIPGELPDPAAESPGCPFAPRCPQVMDLCWEVDPSAREVGPQHRSACHLPAITPTGALTP